MTDLARQQEIMGYSLTIMSVVFRNVDRLIMGGMEPKPDDRKRYVIGADLAKHQDFTVVIVMDDSGMFALVDRFGSRVSSKSVHDISKRYGNARVLLDSTGVGDPVYDSLRAMAAR